MTKRITSLFLVLALCMTFFPVMASAEESEEPVEEPIKTSITTVNELLQFAQDVNAGKYDGKENAVVSLDADLDLKDVSWTPIGQVNEDGKIEHYFSGMFCGNGHTISNITIGMEDTPSEIALVGLFGVAAGRIQDLFLDTISINATADYVGSLVGYAGGVIENCHVTNLTLNAKASGIGGLTGYILSSSSIYGCSTSGVITAKSGCQAVGGFTGSIGKNAQITYSSADVMVTAPDEGGTNAGGFIGQGNANRNELAIFGNCYAKGNITGGSYAGGFAGGLQGLKIKNCYATGDVTRASASMASFLGTDASGWTWYGSIENCYTTGDVVGTTVYPYAFAPQSATERSEFINNYYVDSDANKAVLKEAETSLGKSLDDMKTEAFATLLNAGDAEANGWIYKKDQTPLCGAEPADYSAVDEALKKIPADLTFYTDETIAALETAKANVVRGKVIAKQSEVDAMEDNLEKAIAGLELKDADYSKVDEAIAKANALNKSDYKDFTKVEEAIEAVVRGKKIDEQEKVDAMAKAIEDAITALERKPSSSGSGSSRPSYSVTTPTKPDNGTVTVNPANAKSGNTVTITVTPDSGYKLGDLVVTDKDGKKLILTDKGNGQYTFTMPSGKVEVTADFVKEGEVSPFDDVATDAYYYDAVKWAVANGVTNGVSENLFGPEQACTRAQIVTFLWRAAGSPEPKSMSSFVDVAADTYYAKAVAWAVENGVTKGTAETTFSPDETCTRAQGVTFLYRVLGKLAAAQARFTDVAADAYYANAVNWAAESGVTKGISETLFGPNGACTRAQIVTFLYRAYLGK